MDNRLTILIVDDMAVNRLILKGIVAEEYDVLEADHGLSALEILRSGKKIDIILLDLIMPKMSGIEFLRIIKEDEAFREIPVIVNTQAGEQENEYLALEIGADDFIVKPYHPMIVKKRIVNIAEKYIFQRNNMKRKIQDTTNRLETLIDTVPGGIGIFVIRDVVQTTYINDGLCAILGYTREEMGLLGKKDALEFVFYEDRFIVERVLKTESGSEEILHCKVRLLRKNGQKVWVGISAKRLKGDNGDRVYDAVFMDLSEEIRNETKLKHSMMELKFRAERDPLTGLFNRETFYLETEKMLRENPDTDYIIGHWNIDRFKVINELFGSRTGDRILCNIANLIRLQVKCQGTYGRLEADHFVTCTPRKMIDKEIQKIEEILMGMGGFNPLNYPILSHVGFYLVEDRNTAVDLMCDRANMALQKIKGNHLKRWNYYNETLKERIMDEQHLINDMEHALQERQFVLAYQPIVDVATQSTVSAEVLVRWKHPQKGLVSPGLFIPLFEKNGFISKLDMYVCEEACRHQAEQQRLGNKVIPISVNLSRINFYNPNLCIEILNLVNKYEIAPECIKLEITESAYKDNPQDLLNAINSFQKCGFKILMDDFGSGYSSLNMLKDYCVDILKIDMKFMNDLETSERAGNIIFSIIQMAKALQMETVAEGVETKTQFEMLAGMGVDGIQGYYFSKPIWEEEFVERLQKEEQLEAVNAVCEKKQTVLVVDDAEVNRIAIREIIKKKYNVIEAENGRAALDILKNQFGDINLVITDICMPEMNGLELLEEMTHITFLRRMPVLVVTAYAEAENEEQALKFGALDVISKPFNPEILKKRVENLLKVSRNDNIQHEVQILRKRIAAE